MKDVRFISSHAKTLVFLICLLFITACAGARREAYVRDHPHISEHTRECILKGSIIIGMDKEEVIASWGKPKKINRTVGSWGVHEQWVYGSCNRYGCDMTYLYFEDGLVKSWQD